MARPGRVLRNSLIVFGVLFLPLGLWFAYKSWRRYWGNALGLIVVSGLFLWLGLDRRATSWLAPIDDLDDPPPNEDGTPRDATIRQYGDLSSDVRANDLRENDDRDARTRTDEDL